MTRDWWRREIENFELSWGWVVVALVWGGLLVVFSYVVVDRYWVDEAALVQTGTPPPVRWSARERPTVTPPIVVNEEDEREFTSYFNEALGVYFKAPKGLELVPVEERKYLLREEGVEAGGEVLTITRVTAVEGLVDYVREQYCEGRESCTILRDAQHEASMANGDYVRLRFDTSGTVDRKMLELYAIGSELAIIELLPRPELHFVREFRFAGREVDEMEWAQYETENFLLRFPIDFEKVGEKNFERSFYVDEYDDRNMSFSVSVVQNPARLTWRDYYLKEECPSATVETPKYTDVHPLRSCIDQLDQAEPLEVGELDGVFFERRGFEYRYYELIFEGPEERMLMVRLQGCCDTGVMVDEDDLGTMRDILGTFEWREG